MTEEEAKLAPLTEFETKYDIGDSKRIQFKQIAQELEGLKEVICVEGPDRYYTPKSKDVDALFARYRKAAHEKKPTEWLTYKKKIGKNNVQRLEPNLIVTGSSLEVIESSLTMHSYEFNFSIYKYCDIYIYKDATLVFYTVLDSKGSLKSFIEIEVDEATIQNLTEDEAWDVIRKYEAALEPLGITYKNRKQLSLFDMYKQEMK